MSRPDSTQMDLQSYLGKPISDLQQHFGDWLIEKTGYDPNGSKNKTQAFFDGIRLGAQLRMAHQNSPEAKEFHEERKAEREQAAVEKMASKPVIKPDSTDDTPRPAPARRPAKNAKAAVEPEPAAPVKAVRRRPAKAAAGAATAPF